MLQNAILKIRTVKNYPQAHNHLLVGKLLECTSSYIKVHSRTFHFGASVTGPKAIKTGNNNIRIIPWLRVEIINELPGQFDYANAQLQKDDIDRIVLTDGKCSCVINASAYDHRY